MSRRQSILNFLRNKPREDVEDYAISNGVYRDGASKDELDNTVADVLDRKGVSSRFFGARSPRVANARNRHNERGLNRWANQYGSGTIPDKEDCRGDGDCPGVANAHRNRLGALSPRTRNFLGARSPRLANARNNQGGLNRWANQYGSGTIPDEQDMRGESPASRRWQQRLRETGAQLRQANARAGSRSPRNRGNLSPRSTRANARDRSESDDNTWGNQYGSGTIADVDDLRGESAASRRWQQEQRAAGMGAGLSASEAAVEASRARRGITGEPVNFTRVTPAIADEASRVVDEITGGGTELDLSQYTEAVRALAGSTVNGQKVSATQSTQALKPYYTPQSPRGRTTQANAHLRGSRSRSGSRSPRLRTANARNNNLTNTMNSNAGANEHDPFIFLKATKECTRQTPLNAPECSVMLDDIYEAPNERPEQGAYREAVRASAEAKLGGQSIEEVLGIQNGDLATFVAESESNLGNALTTQRRGGTLSPRGATAASRVGTIGSLGVTSRVGTTSPRGNANRVGVTRAGTLSPRSTATRVGTLSPRGTATRVGTMSPRRTGLANINVGSNLGSGANVGFSNVGTNVGANQSNARGHRGRTTGTRRSVSLSPRGANARNRLANRELEPEERGSAARAWKSEIETCTATTDLNAVECTVMLGSGQTTRESPYREAVRASAEAKLGGMSLEEAMAVGQSNAKKGCGC